MSVWRGKQHCEGERKLVNKANVKEVAMSL